MPTKNDIQWINDHTFSFAKGTRPTWTAAAKKIHLTKGEDRRHGLHGTEVITKAIEIFINNSLKDLGKQRTKKKLYTNLKSRRIPLRDLNNETLSQLITTFRKYAFSKVTNLLPGDGDYNKAIEAVRKKVVSLKKKQHIRFFSQGETPDEIEVMTYKSYLLKALQIKNQKRKSKRKQIIDEIIQNVLIPMVENSQTILAIDHALTAIEDTTKIDIAFSEAPYVQKYNTKILALETRIKRGIVAEEGLTQEIFNALIGYKPRRKRKMHRDNERSTLF